ncbi:hypothetical protein PbB2_00070 [Candidatus Phycosocius bacilliformis]|uniref:Uncharacterized protein n=1 Tax=Candidatus Phycosocius bacilliformis TaxID=1445552 RepID=A0A2P2E5T5_9PROT|nr:hypothetical protein PbB2_00070 [Candidatus Phycosocius bacilliformis]
MSGLAFTWIKSARRFNATVWVVAFNRKLFVAKWMKCWVRFFRDDLRCGTTNRTAEFGFWRISARLKRRNSFFQLRNPLGQSNDFLPFRHFDEDVHYV